MRAVSRNISWLHTCETVPIPTELAQSSRRLARRAANSTHNKQQYRQLACRFGPAVRLYDCEWPKEGTER